MFLQPTSRTSSALNFTAYLHKQFTSCLGFSEVPLSRHISSRFTPNAHRFFCFMIGSNINCQLSHSVVSLFYTVTDKAFVTFPSLIIKWQCSSCVIVVNLRAGLLYDNIRFTDSESKSIYESRFLG